MKTQTIYSLMLIVLLAGCTSTTESADQTDAIDKNNDTSEKVELVVLGTIQDAGSPQIGCNKECCRELFDNPDPTRQVVSLGIIDHISNEAFLFEATPHMPRQMKMLTALNSKSSKETADGIFLTHAHIGHYTGLMYLGKEAMDAQSIPVYAMTKMSKFLQRNGPWNQLIDRTNILLQEMRPDSAVQLTERLKVVPFLVPHRDEYSETAGFRIDGPAKSVLFIPDIDKWSRWERDIIKEVQKVDYAYLDATFYSGVELDNRDMSEIPHPSILETMQVFDDLPVSERQKIRFIHFNHTNPLLDTTSSEYQKVIEQSFGIAGFGDRIEL